MLKSVENRLKEQKINITIDKSVKQLIANQGINKDFGARPLRRTIQNLVEDNLAAPFFIPSVTIVASPI